MTPEIVNVDPPRQKIVLDESPAVIRRSRIAGIQLDDQFASRQHRELDEVDGTLVLRDLKSKNEACLNGETVEVAPLRPDHRITIGCTPFRVGY